MFWELKKSYMFQTKLQIVNCNKHSHLEQEQIIKEKYIFDPRANIFYLHIKVSFPLFFQLD